jgi:hypothetical protein
MGGGRKQERTEDSRERLGLVFFLERDSSGSGRNIHFRGTAPLSIFSTKRHLRTLCAFCCVDAAVCYYKRDKMLHIIISLQITWHVLGIRFDLIMPYNSMQAILPLRGKILNIERRDEAALYKNEEIQNLIRALGLGVKVCIWSFSLCSLLFIFALI